MEWYILYLYKINFDCYLTVLHENVTIEIIYLCGKNKNKNLFLICYDITR